MKILLVMGLALLLAGCAAGPASLRASHTDDDAILKRVVEADLSDGLVIQNAELRK